MPLQATSGAASYDAFGGGAAAVPVYIEDLFNTYLYTGNDTTQIITNGIDLATKGGMVWVKGRDGATNHTLVDTARGTSSGLITNTTDAAGSSGGFTSFDTTGFTFGGGAGARNNNGTLYVTWTFRKQPKFFDVVTYSGTGSTRTVPHNLGSVPGCIIIKNLSDTDGWLVYHRSIGATKTLSLNTTGAAVTDGNDAFNDTEPTSTVFTVSVGGKANQSGNNYVAYLFAHDAGGFGLTGTDNVVSCGSFTGSASGTTVNLGWEPQWVLIKRSSGNTDNWRIYDNMRGMTASNGGQLLYADTSGSETTNSRISVNATGFGFVDDAAYGNIYIAIRRGPMKVPTSGTSVFSPIVATNSQGTENTTGFPLDMQIANIRSGYASNGVVPSRLTGVSSNTTSSGSYLRTPSTNAEQTGSDITQYWGNTGFQTSSNWAGSGMVYWNFRRAPSFFDEVCYTGTGVANTAFTHNLTVTPELMIVKPRSAATAPNWRVWSPINSTDFNLLQLSTDGAASSSLYSSSNVFPAIPTATTFTVGGSGSIQLNQSGQTFVAYLFATCAGVSKVGSVTHSEPTTVSCGFTPRFVMLKSTQDTGTNDWFVFDSARGITSGNDPYLRLNSTGAENTPFGAADLIDPTADGFIMNGFNGGNYIFLAIA